MHRDIRLQGKWMYNRSDIDDLIKLVENGMLRLDAGGGIDQPKTFRLEQWKEAFGMAAKKTAFGKSVVITP